MDSNHSFLEIDGSYGEGGGQIVRTALALSTLTQRPIHITQIRVGREKPGLKAQHLTAINALKELCAAETNEIDIGSEELFYTPHTIRCHNFRIDIGTAGSVSLLLQALFLPLLFGNRKSELIIRGGTSGEGQMPIEYLQHVYLPVIARYGRSIELVLHKRGYYPKGNGEVILTIKPQFKISRYDSFVAFREDVARQVLPIRLLERGSVLQIKGISHASLTLMEREVAERQARAAESVLKQKGIPVTVSTEYRGTDSVGSGITLYAKCARGRIDGRAEGDDVSLFLGSSENGELRKSAEVVGKNAARELIAELDSGAPVDKHLADNVVPFLIFGGGFRASTITTHTETNIWVVNQFFRNSIVREGTFVRGVESGAAKDLLKNSSTSSEQD